MSTFGKGAEVVEPAFMLPEGDYQVKLGMPVDIEKGGYNIRKIPFAVRGHADCLPNSWDWFDIPTDDVEKIQKWNRQMTKNADAFGVRRLDFNPKSWVNKTGWLHIGKNTKTGYMEVKWAVLKDEVGKPAPKEMKPEPKKEVKKPEVDPEYDNGYQTQEDSSDPWEGSDPDF